MAPAGALAEWLGRGLQSLVRRFESARRLLAARIRLRLRRSHDGFSRDGNEWLGLIEVTGLELESLHGGFAGEPFTDESFEYVFVVRR